MLATFAALVAFFSTLGLSERIAQHVDAPNVAALPAATTFYTTCSVSCPSEDR